MKLYISSYKLGNKTDELKKWISEHDNKIAFIPNARDIYEDSERKRQGLAEDAGLLEDLGFEVTTLDLKNYFGKTDGFQQELKKFHAFFAIGGNTFTLRQAMKLSGFDEYLKSLVGNDAYLYGGYSAGICVLAPDLHGLDIVDDANVDPYGTEVIFEGLGIIDYLPLPHFESDHPESELINEEVEYCKKNHVKYRTLRDGDVIII